MTYHPVITLYLQLAGYEVTTANLGRVHKNLKEALEGGTWKIDNVTWVTMAEALNQFYGINWVLEDHFSDVCENDSWDDDAFTYLISEVVRGIEVDMKIPLEDYL